MKIKRGGRWWYLWPGHASELLRSLTPTKAADIEDDLDEMEVVVQTENLIVTYDSDSDLLIYIHESLLK